MAEGALGGVPLEAEQALHVLETELADEDAGEGGELHRVRREVPERELAKVS